MINYNYIKKHRRAVLLVLLTCAFAINAKAQLWNKTYIEDRGVMLFSSVLFDDSIYVVTGVVNDTQNTQATKSILGKINMNGNMVNYHSFVDTSHLDYYGVFTNTLIKTTEGKFAFTGIGYTSLAYLVFGMGNASLDSISVFRYYTPNTFTYHGYSLLEDSKSYYISGLRTDSIANDVSVVLTKIDSCGNRVWEKYYNSMSYAELAKSLIKLKNGNLMLGAMRRDLNQTQEHANTWLIEVDTGGNVVRQWFDPNDSTYAAEGLLQTQDGGFIYGAQKKREQTVNSVWYTATIVKLDSNFNKQWTYTDGYQGELTGFSDVEVLSDGSIIACGKYSYRDALIVKLSASGQLIWRRTYVGLDAIGSENYLTDIDILPDGGLIAVGQCQNLNQAPAQVGWFLKLDSNGCEIENCTVGINEVAEKMQLNVYPNPFSNQITIALNEAVHQQVSLSITNLIGQTIYTTTEHSTNSNYTKNLDLRYLPNGIYFIMVNVDGEKIVKQLLKE